MQAVDLNTPWGNAYALIGLARTEWAKRGHGSAECAALVDALTAAPSYAALLDLIDARLPGAFVFQHDPRRVPKG